MTTTPPGPQKGPVTRERAFEIGREAIAEYERRRAEAPQKA